MRCRSRRPGAGVVLCWAALAASACDGTKPVTALARPSAPAPLESASTCSAAWQPFTSPRSLFTDSVPSGVPTSPLVYQGGVIYYATSGNDLVALPTDGSPSTTLASLSTPTSELWIEGTNLLFSQGALNNQIYTLPVSGGTPELLLDGGANRLNARFAGLHAFNATDFYWVEGTSRSSLTQEISQPAVWRQSRASGAVDQIGAFASDVTLDHLALAANAVLTGGQWLDPRYPPSPVETDADAFPFDGSGRAPLSIPYSPPTDPAPFVAGADALGVYWSIPGTDAHLSALILSPADGGAARAVWPSLPYASANFGSVGPSPEAGWVLVGAQQFDDGTTRLTITLVDPRGTATLLGCAPTDAADDIVVYNPSVAVAADAVYFTTQNQRTFTWEIDRIPR